MTDISEMADGEPQLAIGDKVEIIGARETRGYGWIPKDEEFIGKQAIVVRVAEHHPLRMVQIKPKYYRGKPIWWMPENLRKIAKSEKGK